MRPASARVSRVSRRAAAAELAVVASRVRRLVPGAPALQKELHSIARDITVLAKYAAPSRVPSAVKIDIRTRRRGRLINTTQTIKGRRLIWQDLTRGYLQPAGVIVLPGGHAGFAAGFAGG